MLSSFGTSEGSSTQLGGEFMAVYQTEYGNFGSPEDILRYMRQEGIEKIHVTLIFCGEALGKKDFEMTVPDVEKWIGGGKRRAGEGTRS